MRSAKYLLQLFIPFIGIPHKMFNIFVHIKGSLSVSKLLVDKLDFDKQWIVKVWLKIAESPQKIPQ